MIYAVLFFLSLSCVHADQESYQHGKNLANQLNQGIQNAVPEGVPVVNPEQTQEGRYLEEFHEMSERAMDLTHNSEVGRYVLESQQAQQEEDYRVTEESEIIKSANEVVSDPLKYIGGEEEREEGGEREVVETTHLCEESAESVTYTCDQTRHVKLKKIQEKHFERSVRYRRSLFGYSKYHFSYFSTEVSPGERVAHTGPEGYFEGWYSLYKDVEILSAKITDDVIEDACSGHEAQSNKGLCVYGEEEILEGPEEREFCQGEDCIKITRDWWKRRRTYHCKQPSKDNCGPFRAAGCDQVKASCLKRIEGVCVNNQKTFLCRSIALGNGKVRFKGDVPFCMDGNCDDHSWAGNKDFAEAMSKLSLFQEISKDMNVGSANAMIFRGDAMKCSKSVADFQDCCGSGGWGRSVGLGQNCQDDEKILKKEREAQKCVRIGTYCAEEDPIFKVCLRKKTSFCCFGSKLSKLLQEQGRAQLGIGWGDVEHPNCRAFSIDEIHKIDFSKIDFSSLYADLRAKTTVENVSTAAEGMGGRWADKVQAAQARHGKKVTASEMYNTQENPDVSL